MSILRHIFETLREYYAAKSDYQWWPENPIEVIFGAVLVQGSTWKSVDKVLHEFRTNKLLDFSKIVHLTEEQLAVLIRPVGFQMKKAKRLQAISRLILERSAGDLPRFFARDADVIRRELLSLSGIGHGTADNILLYAGQVPIYMVDTFTSRVLIRHGVTSPFANELQIQELVHQELTPDEEPYGAKLFQKMQEFLVRVGREFCDKSSPDCSHCPLNVYLPEDGAMGVDIKPASKQKSQRTAMVSQEIKPIVTPPIEPVNLNENERKIVAAIGETPISIDAVVLATELPVHIVRATIAVLQMKKQVYQVEGNQVKRV